ncbi:GIY-YIG nuclease family protein [Candidatus Saccharibacteria bacterium]|nr:GIY-YIG nuclease family protein [Candidatus Saccharibacteria bacterium]
MYYVYILQSQQNQQFYTGFTSDLKTRITQHNSGKSTYTSMHRPYDLIYYEASTNRVDATAREKYLKSGMGKRYLKNRLKHQLNKDTVVSERL